MLFNSWQFAVFLPIVLLLYWIIPNKFRWPVLLVASYVFYMFWSVKYALLLLATTCVSFFAAFVIQKAQSQKIKKTVLVASLVLFVGSLVVFKYFNFLAGSVSKLLNTLSVPNEPIMLNLILPLGISFYTFQSIGYVVDVYRGDCQAEKNIGIYAAFVSFFPQLVAGPIERTGNLLPQLKEDHLFDGEKALFGLKLMLWGFFKKIVVADNIAAFVDIVYGNLHEYRGFALVLATFFFTIQIYCDFSGYTDIARGVAMLFGIDLIRNFDSPYYSQSVKDFWGRWHMSLSTWFRDYVYIPLGGNRVGKVRHCLNLLLTFLVSGLWHGANWTFVIWGGIHGVAQIAENGLRIKPSRNKALKAVRVFVVFLFVMLTWVFFRAESLNDAVYVFSNILDGITRPVSYLRSGMTTLGLSFKHLAFCVAFYLIPLTIIDFLGKDKKTDGITVVEAWKLPLRWVFYVLLGLVVIFFSKKGIATEFVYFQF